MSNDKVFLNGKVKQFF